MLCNFFVSLVEEIYENPEDHPFTPVNYILKNQALIKLLIFSREL
jgi:hypothetical protein